MGENMGLIRNLPGRWARFKAWLRRLLGKNA
jgi:hypothetical protein